MSSENIVNFADYQCKLELNYYDKEKRRLSIQLVSAISDVKKDLWEGTPIARATYNDPIITPAPDQVIIKNCRENMGMVEALFQAGLIEGRDGKIHHEDKTMEIVVMKKSSSLIEMENSFRAGLGVAPLNLSFFIKPIEGDDSGSTDAKRKRLK